MKLAIVLIASVVMSFVEFIFFNVLPSKTDKTIFVILSHLAFWAIFLITNLYIYRLGELWDIENQTRIVLGLGCAMVFLGSFVYK